MSNSSNPPGKTNFRSVPPPQGGKTASTYSRFIPREELGEVASWKPGSFFGALDAAPPSASPGPAPDAKPAPGASAAEPLAARVHDARQSGYQDGYRDGMAALESFKQHFAAQATAQIGGLIEAFDRQFAELDTHLAEVLTRCAVQLARQVVRSELALRPQLVAQVAADALDAVMLSARHISVMAHPGDLPLIREGAEEALAARGARLAADAALARGDVRVVSDLGSVDARIAERWAQAAGALDASVPWQESAGESPA